MEVGYISIDQLWNYCFLHIIAAVCCIYYAILATVSRSHISPSFLNLTWDSWALIIWWNKCVEFCFVCLLIDQFRQVQVDFNVIGIFKTRQIWPNYPHPKDSNAPLTNLMHAGNSNKKAENFLFTNLSWKCILFTNFIKMSKSRL